MNRPPLWPRPADFAGDGPVVAVHDPDDIVHDVGDEYVFLLSVGREIDGANRTALERVVGDEIFFDELALFREYLDAVAAAIADVDQAIVRNLDAMNGVAEIFRRRPVRVVGRGRVVVELIDCDAVSAPGALEFPAFGIPYHDPLIDVAVGDVEFAGFLVQGKRGGLAGQAVRLIILRLLVQGKRLTLT